MGMMINDAALTSSLRNDGRVVFLPEWFSPSDKDVVCGWARQHQGHGMSQTYYLVGVWGLR
jgi:hypothetical protein